MAGTTVWHRVCGSYVYRPDATLATAVPGLQSSSSSVHPCSTCPRGLSSHDLEYRQHWAHDAQVWGDYKTYYLVASMIAH